MVWVNRLARIAFTETAAPSTDSAAIPPLTVLRSMVVNLIMETVSKARQTPILQLQAMMALVETQLVAQEDRMVREFAREVLIFPRGLFSSTRKF